MVLFCVVTCKRDLVFPFPILFPKRLAINYLGNHIITLRKKKKEVSFCLAEKGAKRGCFCVLSLSVSAALTHRRPLVVLWPKKKEKEKGLRKQ